MKKLLPFFLLLLFIFPSKKQEPVSEKDLYRLALNYHRYSQRPHLSPADVKKIPKRDRPDLAWEQDFLATMDPATGRPAPERLLPVYQQVAQSQSSLMAVPGSASSPWVERGPSNVSGRTRAIMYDPNASSGTKVWAGGVTGGLWYNNDITSSSSSWVAVNDFWDNIAITAIAYDPTNTNTMYVGTGEGWGAGSGRGAGVWKSTNGGASWSQLSATTGFYYVNDLVVRNEGGNGVLYVALRGNYYGQSWHGSSDQGLQRSINGGTSFTQVLPNVPGESINYAAADIEIGADNSLWVGTTTSSYSATDRGGGRVLSSTNGTTWTVSYTSSGGERVEVACAPSDANYVYAIVESGNAVDGIVRTTNGGTSWSSLSEPSDADNGIPSTDFSRGQAWYDLIIAVDPNDRNTVLAGAIDLFRTTNGGTSWSQISKWSNNNNLAALNCSNVHADQHQIVFKPGSSSQVLFGNDGGVYYSNNIGSAATSNVIFPRDNGYNVTQFYSCAIHPTAASNYSLAGAQDNGTQQFSTTGVNATNEVTGGDGGFCFIDQSDPSYQVTSYVYNSYWRSTNGGLSFGSRFQSDQSTGKFINPTDYDDNLNILYSARTSSTINRVTNMTGSPSIGDFTVSGMSSMASHLRVSPYTTTSTTLFVGTGAGDLYKITNADGASPSAVSIGSSLPGGNISCVEIGASENELLVTLSNYGLTSVWYTSNGGTSWVSKEGNLPDMPVRWALFNPNNRNEVILATEVGVWSTSNFNSSTPSWSSSNSGLANVRVDMLQIRQSDYEVIAATYGRGLFSSNGFAAAQVPVANFGYSSTYPCVGQTVTLGDSSSGAPTSWQWTITPNTYSYASGSTANSQNPEVSFNASGWYTVKLVVSNANGTDSMEVSQAIRAGGHTLPFVEDFETASVNEWTVQNPDNSNTWSLFSVGGITPGSNAAGIDNFNYNAAGQRDGLISPNIDLSGYTQATLSFEYAYKRYSAGYSDSLAVYISTNCGSTWNRIASYSEDGSGNFAMSLSHTTGFTPAITSDWCGSTGNPSCPSIDISAYAGNPNVSVKIENICGYGNNMYIDNVNVTGSVSLAPVADFSAGSTTVCLSDTVIFTDLSTNAPTGWSWSFNPSTVTYVNGTSANSQNPEVQFNSSGTYQVSLTATNSTGSDAEVKSAYITVNSTVTPAVSITASNSSICAGTAVTFTATPVNGGASPGYQWKVNGISAGSNSATFNSSTLANGDMVSLEMQSSANCPSTAQVSSNNITMNVSPVLTPSVSVAASATTICTGGTVNFTATPTNGGGSPAYQWKVNGTNAGTNSPTFSSSALSNGDVVTVVMTSSESCVSNASATSTGITISVTSPLTPSLGISASSTTICSGTSVTFTATPTNGGINPSYQWKVNGLNVGSGGATFSSSSLANNDVVTAVLTSSESCVTSPTVTSNAISMTVNSALVPTATISTSDTTICAGSTTTFNATITNGGTPAYQWKVNGNNVGTNSPTLTVSNLTNNDVVTVQVTSSLSCASPVSVTSAGISMVVVPEPQININTTIPIGALCKDDTLALSATVNSFGHMGIGNWTGPGVQGGKFIAALAGPGTHTLTYGYAHINAPFCSSSETMQVQVDIVPKPTISANGMVLTCNQSGFNYQWIKNGTAIPGANTQSYMVTGNGTYSIRIGSVYCTDQSDPFVIQNFGMEDLKAAIGFKLYPNPTKSTTKFEFTNPGVSSVHYELIAFNGAVVMRKEISADSMVSETIDLSHLANGIYSLRVIAGDYTFVERIGKK